MGNAGAVEEEGSANELEIGHIFILLKAYYN